MDSLGWKDILRPIRDRLRDVIPPFHDPPPEPSPDDRRQQQRADALKGFAYLEGFDELAAWSPSDVDPLQRSNIPLLPRNLSAADDANGGLAEGKAKVLLVHDYAGGYHDYEAIQGARVAGQMYRCGALQFVEAFVYFSHRLVSIPPPVWVNSMHRSGVPVLGTFIVEPQTKGAEAILETAGRQFPVARKLAQMAERYGFDGWLLNIEKSFNREQWDLSKFMGFLEELKSCMGKQGLVIWYDALTVNNDVFYQNSLTTDNVAFTKACGAILTNYRWNEEDLISSKELALQEQISEDKIYFGVDVWAQNKRIHGPRRITYPPKGGGGTNTGVAVAKAADYGFSAGLFAPAWPFEHCQKHALEVDLSMWDGDQLPAILDCGCGKEKPHHSDLYQTNPICRRAVEFPLGSSQYLHTTFTGGYAASATDSESTQLFDSCISTQTPLPHLRSLKLQRQNASQTVDMLFGELLESPSRLVISCARALQSGAGRNDRTTRWFRLFPVRLEGDLRIQITYRVLSCPRNSEIKFFVAHKTNIDSVPLSKDEDKVHTLTHLITTPSVPQRDPIREVGFFVAGPSFKLKDEGPLLEVLDLLVEPNTPVKGETAIQNVQIKLHDDSKHKHWRLQWSFSSPYQKSKAQKSFPVSRTTGPFDHFAVEIFSQKQSVHAGIAHCCEYALQYDAIKQCLEEGELEARVCGHTFGGRSVESEKVILEIH